MASITILEKLYFAISKGPITFNKLCRATKLHPRTVRRYVKLIEYMQGKEKITVEREGFKVVMKRA
ncbi:MAG: hypothetical protein NTV88_04860 [Candidatus Micrarchaeota archaeon]|nr:hypothetical protein [Candidatus Micrarchaeota archaeon]